MDNESLPNNSNPVWNSNSAYDTFNGGGVHWPLVALFGTKAFVCLVGIVANLDLVLITWNTKTLRKACNLQIALCAFSIIVQQHSSLITFAVVLSGTNFIPLGICAIVQALPLFFSFFTTAISFFIGFDRFLSLVFPVWYRNRDSNRRYFYAITIACSFFSAIGTIIGLCASASRPALPVMCTVVDPLQDEGQSCMVVQLCINCAMVACYLLIWWLLLCTKSKSMKAKQMKIFKSLTIILVLEILGWTSNYAIRLIVAPVQLDPLFTWYLINIATISPYVSLSLSPFALYIFSCDYRRAFLCQFGIVVASNTVHPNIKRTHLLQNNFFLNVANSVQQQPTSTTMIPK